MTGIVLFERFNYDDVIEMEREGKYINLKKSNDEKRYFRFDLVEREFQRINFYKTVDDKITTVPVKNITGWFKSAKIITKDEKFARLVIFNKYHYDFQKYRNPVRFIEMLGNPKTRFLEEWESLGIKITDMEEWYEKYKEYTNGSYWYLHHSMSISKPPSDVSKSLLNYIKNKGEVSINELNNLITYYNNGEFKVLNKLIEMEKQAKYSNMFDIDAYYMHNINCLISDDYRSKNTRNNIIKAIQNYHLDIDAFCEWVRYQRAVEKNDISYIADHYGDYLRMAVALNNGARSKVTKYPKHFRDVRQRTIVEYKAIEEQISEYEFKRVVEDNKNLEYKTKKYSIVLPESPKDIEFEASILKHCVRSYIKPMSRNQTLICFCRFTEHPEEPLVTIEVKRRVVTQAYTKHDKKPKQEQLDFIEKWANKNNLLIGWCW